MKREVRLPEGARGRLDRVLADTLSIGRAVVKRAFETGDVRIRGRRVRASDPAEPGTLVEIDLEPLTGPPEPEPGLPLRVLADGVGWLVAEKPAGMATHPLRGGEMGTLANAVVARFPQCAGASPDPRDGGALQRLDLETSGCVLFAKDRGSWEALRAQFTARTVEKLYTTLVCGRLSSGGICTVALAQRGVRVVPVPDLERPPKALAEPRPAETRYEVLRSFAEQTLLEVRIVTGVMHQIRAHMAYLGHPVMGDTAYGDAGAALPGLDRQFLHASLLGFQRPEGGTVRVESSLPPELQRVLESLPPAQ